MKTRSEEMSQYASLNAAGLLLTKSEIGLRRGSEASESIYIYEDNECYVISPTQLPGQPALLKTAPAQSPPDK